ncbi:hypothetical protein AYO45_02335 [Gammaproteobacteria bacterium SCGC AG-212-F23]|nr:hypothetical protein AYO45_02335 [Gammaproteobacteria bacterium SCGC AG-212-F23]
MKKHLSFISTLCIRFFDESLTYRASALAFTTLLALVPLLAVIVSALTLLPWFGKFTLIAQEYVMDNFIPTSGAVIQQYLEGFIHQATQLPRIGILFLIVTAIMLMITIEHSFNEIWKVRRRRKTMSSLLIHIFILILAPIFVGLSVLVSTFVFSLHWIKGATNLLGIETWVLRSLPLLINTLLFAILYMIVPNCKVYWRDNLIGGLTAAVLFEFAKKGFAFYILQFPSYAFIYGALATVPIFFLWIYISWLVILIGAMVSHQLAVESHQ